MKRPNFIPYIGMALCVPLILVACSENAVLNQSTDNQGVPVWVNDGSNIVKAKDNRLFNGVGSAPMLGDLSLQTATANKRAKDEIARIIASYMEIVSRDYIASGQASDAGFDEQVVAQQIDSLAKMDLSKVEIVGHWTDKETKAIYAIAQMDMNEVKKIIKEIIAMNKGLKAYIGTEGDSIFDRMAKKEEGEQ